MSRSEVAHRAVARRRAPGQHGVVLVSLLVGMTVLIILLTASAQSWSIVMKREREEELLFRGNQYIIALQQYAKDHGGAFPMKLDELLEEGPRGHRYIRQLFPDPFDKDGEWNLLYLAPGGKGAINPNARFPQAGVVGAGGVMGAGSMGQPGAMGQPGVMGQQAGLGATRAGVRAGAMGLGSNQRSDRSRGLGDRDDEDRDRRRSGFAGAEMNAPVVGVVSRSDERGFKMYYGRHYYDEWEFHVFQQQIQDPQRRGTGMNINPTGQIGPGHGITPAGTTGDVGGRGMRAPDKGRGN
jgi:type II secretory pathway pseudopilin PulG